MFLCIWGACSQSSRYKLSQILGRYSGGQKKPKTHKILILDPLVAKFFLIQDPFKSPCTFGFMLKALVVFRQDQNYLGRSKIILRVILADFRTSLDIHKLLQTLC